MPGENHSLERGHPTAFAADKLPTRCVYGAIKRVCGLLPQMKIIGPKKYQSTPLFRLNFG